MDLTLKVWRQAGPQDKGQMVTYPVSGIEDDMSFLEMMDVLNEQLVSKGEEPVVFDHDCREGICGSCSLYIRWRGARSCTWTRDLNLMVDRSAFVISGAQFRKYAGCQRKRRPSDIIGAVEAARLSQ